MTQIKIRDMKSGQIAKWGYGSEKGLIIILNQVSIPKEQAAAWKLNKNIPYMTIGATGHMFVGLVHENNYDLEAELIDIESAELMQMLLTAIEVLTNGTD